MFFNRKIYKKIEELTINYDSKIEELEAKHVENIKKIEDLKMELNHRVSELTSLQQDVADIKITLNTKSLNILMNGNEMCLQDATKKQNTTQISKKNIIIDSISKYQNDNFKLGSIIRFKNGYLTKVTSLGSNKSFYIFDRDVNSTNYNSNNIKNNEANLLDTSLIDDTDIDTIDDMVDNIISGTVATNLFIDTDQYNPTDITVPDLTNNNLGVNDIFQGLSNIDNI